MGSRLKLYLRFRADSFRFRSYYREGCYADEVSKTCADRLTVADFFLEFTANDLKLREGDKSMDAFMFRAFYSSSSCEILFWLEESYYYYSWAATDTFFEIGGRIVSSYKLRYSYLS